MAVLSGAGLFKGTDSQSVHVHTTATAVFSNGGTEIDLSNALGGTTEDPELIDGTAPIFICKVADDGSIEGDIIKGGEVENGKKITFTAAKGTNGEKVFVDFYITKKASKISEIQIDAAHFGGYYYVEASTLFRRKEDGVDMPAEITLPNVKIQSNFTFSMSSSGDPSTFNFTMDAFPGHTMFDKTKEVICVIQVVEDATAGATETPVSVMGHNTSEVISESTSGDSVPNTVTSGS